MTRDEFEEWLAERQAEALDDMPQSDTTAQKWLGRLYAALKAVADQDDAEEADPDEDELFEDEDKEAEEEAEEKEEA